MVKNIGKLGLAGALALALSAANVDDAAAKRMYDNVKGGTPKAYTMLNTGTGPASVDLYFTNCDGVREPVATFDLGAGVKYKHLLDEVGSGFYEFDTNGDDNVAISTVDFSENGSYPRSLDVPSTANWIQHVANGHDWDTEVFFANPNDADVGYSLEHRNKNGETTWSVSGMLDGNSSGSVNVSAIDAPEGVVFNDGYFVLNTDLPVEARAGYVPLNGGKGFEFETLNLDNSPFEYVDGAVEVAKNVFVASSDAYAGLNGGWSHKGETVDMSLEGGQTYGLENVIAGLSENVVVLENEPMRLDSKNLFGNNTYDLRFKLGFDISGLECGQYASDIVVTGPNGQSVVDEDGDGYVWVDVPRVGQNNYTATSTELVKDLNGQEVELGTASRDVTIYRQQRPVQEEKTCEDIHGPGWYGEPGNCYPGEGGGGL